MVALFVVCFLLVLCVVYFLANEYFKSRYLPPGPFPLPLIGNLHLLSSKPYIDFYRLTKTYGPVFRLKLGCNQVVVINNYTYAKEAMLKKGTDFAGRPSQYVGSLFSRDGKGVGFQTYSNMVKVQRKVIIKTIKELEKDSQLENTVCTEVRDLVRHFKNHEGELSHEGLRLGSIIAMNNIVASVAFGERFTEGDTEFSNLIDSLAVFAEGLAATSFIDFFPFLKHLPFSIIERMKEACGARDKILDRKYAKHKKAFKNNCNRSVNLVEIFLEAYETETSRGYLEMSDDHIVMAINDVLIAGSETTATNLLWVIYYLIKYPDIQEKIQRELDDVIGRKRAPKWDERQNLPYLQAFLSEALRTSSSMPLAIPHQAIRDSSLGPYQIPKGTQVVLNVWAIHNDPEMWDNPMKFNPERFLDENGYFSAARATGLLPFGMGHRSCPGEPLAKMEAFLFTSQLLQKFNFKRVEGQGLPEVEDCAYGLVMTPASFDVHVGARN